MAPQTIHILPLNLEKLLLFYYESENIFTELTEEYIIMMFVKSPGVNFG